MAKREPSRAGQYWEKRQVKPGCGCIRVLVSFVAAVSDGQSSAVFDAWHELRVVIQDLLPPSPGRVNRVFRKKTRLVASSTRFPIVKQGEWIWCVHCIFYGQS